VWCIVAAAILLAITVVSFLDGACGLRGLGSEGLPSIVEDDDDEVPDAAEQSFTVLAILQLICLLSFIVAWAYGLFVVLNLFSRQHNARDWGRALWSTDLSDPVFIVTIVVGLVLVLVPLIALCTCLASNLCVGGGAASAGSKDGQRKKHDDHPGERGSPESESLLNHDAYEAENVAAAGDATGFPVTLGGQPKTAAGLRQQRGQ